jgi:hypothetical protein
MHSTREQILAIAKKLKSTDRFAFSVLFLTLFFH